MLRSGKEKVSGNILRHRMNKKECIVVDVPHYGMNDFLLMQRKYPHATVRLSAMQVEREFIVIAESAEDELNEFRLQGLI